MAKPLDQQQAINEAKRIADSHGGSFVSNSFEGVDKKYLWSCIEGHRWEATYYKVVNVGRWCPVCRGLDTPENKLAKAKAVAESHGGELLNDSYQGAHKKYKWKCRQGHEWEATYGTVVNGGYWCWICGVSKRAKSKMNSASESIEKARKLAAEKGGEFLSNAYNGVDRKYRWRCSEGHEWEASYDNTVRAGHWCPQCSLGITERIVRDIFQQLFQTEFPKAKPVWLINNRKNRMEFDGYSESLRFAFEYQGEQHFKEIPEWGHAEHELQTRINDDSLKEVLAKAHEVTLIAVPYFVEPSGLAEWIRSYLIKLGSRPDLIERMIPYQDIIFNSFPLPDARLSVAYKIAKSKGGLCLSRSYLGFNKKHKWKCALGHEWLAPYGAVVKNGQWCPHPECLGQRISASKLNDSISAQQKADTVAKQKGGRYLSSSYLGGNRKHQWKCDKGHEWSAVYQSVVSGGTWCPICAGKDSPQNKYMLAKKIAEVHQGRILNDKFLGAMQKHNWECAKGHQWAATYQKVVTDGKWCPICSGRETPEIRLRLACEVARQKGGLCLSTEIPRATERLRWKCKDGHEWSATYYNVIKKGTWCKTCRGFDTPQNMLLKAQAIAAERGGVCLSAEYLGANRKHLWKCKHGHEWLAAYKHVTSSGSWCPICASNRLKKAPM